MTAPPILLRDGIRWLLVSDDGKNQRYRHPTDPHRFLSVIDPTYTFQPSDADNYLYENTPNTNIGSNTSIAVDGKNLYRRHAILKFDLTSQIVAGSTINSATLSLYYYNYPFTNPSGRTFWAYRITQTAWTELGSTWNKYDGTNSWAAAGGDYTTTNGASTTVPAGYGWMAWTVTAQVQTAVDSVGRVAHFLMRDGDESGSTAYTALFWSNNYTTDTTKRPKLYVDWTAPVAPTVTTQAATGLGLD
jgi:hypothetical protein